MKLKTEELQKFLTVAAQIKPNPVATNLDSIHIECTGQEVVFTKTNQNIWVRYSYVCQPCFPEVFLINERMLNGIALTSKEYEIVIDQVLTGDLRIISGADVLNTRLQDIKLFPEVQMATGERVRIPKEHVERIRIASKYISTSVARTAMNFVQVGAKGIFAANGSIMYTHNAPGLPEVFFDHEPLTTIKSTDDMLYWTSESYDFFQIEGFTFGFIKSVVKPLDYAPIINQPGIVSFACKRQDFVDFCTLVQYTKRQEYPRATLCSINDTCLHVKFIDPDFNINLSRNIEIVSTGPIDEFVFAVDWVEILLKTLPYETLSFVKFGSGHYGVATPEDEGYRGIIARLDNK